ncbi:hypothetical protein [Nitrosomonas sp.]|uniref:hypothetical protein n=1 Tax=Nitrosomonas sp. TaxID=42353 RepID=UPI00260E97F7|nr:hypothetical protein [Nitrosomonas sp.]MCW5601383.1 hypothetical protein [Nitrosomonas sp.]
MLRIKRHTSALTAAPPFRNVAATLKPMPGIDVAALQQFRGKWHENSGGVEGWSAGFQLPQHPFDLPTPDIVRYMECIKLPGATGIQVIYYQRLKW